MPMPKRSPTTCEAVWRCGRAFEVEGSGFGGGFRGTGEERAQVSGAGVKRGAKSQGRGVRREPGVLRCGGGGAYHAQPPERCLKSRC
eukprot:84938-Chlamydomonas_euryale.AAC.1